MSARTPPDAAARERIRTDLDTTLLVEAAAGTGKTTSLVARMVALVASGRCRIETLAAVTFTRKAAAELRGRFTAGLERAAREAAGEERERLAAAASRSERCFVGTIHSFCARLLRERPVEAGVAVGFTELDEDADALLRDEAWGAFVAGLFAAEPPDPRLERLAALGLEVDRLREAYGAFCRHPDVEEWPAPEVDLGDLAPARAALHAYLGHMRRLLPFPEERGTDKLMARYERILRLARLRDLSGEAGLLEVLEEFDAVHGAIQKCWPGGKGQGKAECERWDAFRTDFAGPLVGRWRARRYASAVPLLAAAREAYDGLRAARGVLTYQDLLRGAALLLRDRPKVREYFRRRFTHLLVDEFQDTDPLQAQVVLFLTAGDAAETDWRRCRPRPGSLFVVGDPKQSIYRFRRADIATYQAVRAIIEGAGGAVVTLDANFRTLPGLIAWGNEVFAPPAFPGEATAHAPAVHPLAPGREEAAGDLAGLFLAPVPPEGGRNETAADHDARRTARFIRHALDAGLTVPRTARDEAAGRGPAAVPGDFLVLAWTRRRLARYAAALEELGVPHRVTGGSAWRQVDELGLLAGCLRALVEPENAVALVAVLRGPLFGISDVELYAFRRAGGKFSFTAPVPAAGLEGATAARFTDAFARLRRCAGWLHALSPAAALERAAADLGLVARALAGPGGDGRAGSIAKAFAVLRAEQRTILSAAGVADFLDALIAEEKEFDGLPARAAPPSAVRVMNLHKAKGLEAPVVFLADPGGKATHPPTLHIDRSGGRTRGYLVVAERRGRGRRERVLALPEGWASLAAEEQAFADAERIRLLYVAATRAGTMLSVAQRAKRNGDNPWEFFARGLAKAEAPPLPDPGPQRAPATGSVEVSDAQIDAAGAAAAARWSAAARASCEVRGAKEFALGAAELHRAPAGRGEHGTEWGTVIHFLLETALREPTRDLAALARAALEEQGLSPERADEARATVDAVRASEIWRRAAAAELTLVEAPFAICLEPGDPLLQAPLPPEGGGPAAPAARLPLEGGGQGGGGNVPVLLRGVVDLAFRESGRWVIVDWKTDADAARRRDALVAKYRAQLELYAGLWARIGGEPVAERGIFFVASGEYVRL